MLRNVLVLLAAFGLIVGTAGTAAAGVLAAPDSTMVLQLGGLPGISVTGTYQVGGNTTLTNNSGSHNVVEGANVWSTVGNSAGTSLFTGVAFISNLVLTAANNAGTATPSFSAPNSVGGNLTNANQTVYSGTICPTGCLGGQVGITGQVVVFVGGAPIPFDAGILGIGGTGTIMIGNGGGPPTLVATGGPFVTGKVRITAVTSNVVQLPDRSPVVTGPPVLLQPTSQENQRTLTTMGGFVTSNTTGALATVATVTISGTNNLASASGAGQVTLISPLRVVTPPALAGTIPGIVSKTYVFAPEPGTLLLLASGAAGLVLIGRRRINK